MWRDFPEDTYEALAYLSVCCCLVLSLYKFGGSFTCDSRRLGLGFWGSLRFCVV